MESDTRVNSHRLKFGAFVHTYLTLRMLPLSDVMKLLQEQIPQVLRDKIQAKDVIRKVAEFIDPQILVEAQRRMQEYKQLVAFFEIEKEGIAAKAPRMNEEDKKPMMRWWHTERAEIVEHITMLVETLDPLMDLHIPNHIMMMIEQRVTRKAGARVTQGFGWAGARVTQTWERQSVARRV